MIVEPPNEASHSEPATGVRRHLIITVHGIRTFGDWQDRLEKTLKHSDGTLEVSHYRYGYFSIIAFVIPFVRWIVTRRFRSALLAICRPGAWDRIDIVAHSFGTHLVGWGLYGLPESKRPRIHTIIFAGSVLKPTFRWQNLMGSIHRVVNECGMQDYYLLLGQIAVVFTGMAGRIGFICMENESFRNRYYRFGHSGYFEKNGRRSDEFMVDHWVPLIVNDSPIPPGLPKSAPSVFAGLGNFLINNAEPFKLIFAVTPFIVVILWVVHQRNVAVSRQLAAQAINDLWLNPRSSGDKALQALSVSDTDEAKQALEQAFLQSDVTAVLQDPDKAPLSGVAFSRNGHFVITSTYWGKVWLWELATNRPRQEFPSYGLYRVSTDSLSPDGRQVLTAFQEPGATNYEVRIWNAADGALLARFVASDVGPITSATYSPSGRYIATTGADYTAAIWDATAVLASSGSTPIGIKPLARYRAHEDIVNSIRFNPDNEEYVVTASQDGRAKVWNWKLRKGTELRRYSTSLFSAEFSPKSSNTVLTGGQDGHATLWTLDEASSPPKAQEFQWHKIDVRQASFDSTGTWIVTASADGTAKVWNPADIEKAYTLTGHRGAVTSAAFSPDSQFIATASVDGTARVWMAKPVQNLETNQQKIQYLRSRHPVTPF